MTTVVVNPLKRQWEAMSVARPVPAQAMTYAATYGPLLALKRTQFLSLAHPAWEIVGKWLRSQVDKDINWLVILKGALASGIFFGSDLMEEVMVPKLEGASSWIPDWWESDTPFGYNDTVMFDEEPSAFWLLQVRPYIARFKSILLRFWARHRELNEDKESAEYECPDGASSVVKLVVSYMTRDEQDACVLSLCLMLRNLDVSWGCYDTEKNVALEVLGKLERMSRECAELVFRYIFNQEVHPGRQRRAISILHDVLSSDTLHGLLSAIPEQKIRDVFIYKSEDSDETEGYTCDELLDLPLKARVRLSETTLREMAYNLGGWLIDTHNGSMGGSRDTYRALCEMSVNPTIVDQLMKEAAFSDDDDESTSQDE